MAGKSTKRRRANENRIGKPSIKVIKIENIDYKDVSTLRKFLSEKGKIRSRRITCASVQDQRTIAQAVKNAREMALLPYSGAHTNRH